MADLVIVSNRLPISVRKVEGRLEFYPSTGGLATGLSGYTKRRGTKWIGWPGIASDELTTADKREIERHLAKQRCYPLFLTQAQLDSYYSGYNNDVLWPLFHDLPVTAEAHKHWLAYRRINQLYAHTIRDIAPAGGTVWIHDYHLLLVPELLRHMLPSSKIGLFLHIPFPAPARLRELPHTRQLLRGMLGANLIGFHTLSYCDSFIAACDDQLGTGSTRGYVTAGERLVQVRELPMGIDYPRFAESGEQADMQSQIDRLQKRYRRLRVILTVDRLDPSKGLVERLRAYQQLLRQDPDLRGRVVMVMIVAPSRTDIPAYQKLKQRLDRLLAEIQAEFALPGRPGRPGWQPVEYIYRALPLEEVIPYYHVADVAFITPLRDGMNLVAKEYLAARPDNSGVLVLSTTAGAAEELVGAIQVNPEYPESLVEGLRRALRLPKRELQSRVRRMRRHIEYFTVQRWADTFIDMLQRPRNTRLPVARNLTLARRKQLIDDYRTARRRLILLDYDGTLRDFVVDPAAAKPTRRVLRILQELGENPANDVVLISGREHRNLADWFGALPIDISAEHGALFRRRGGKNWHRTHAADTAWKKPVKELFDNYAAVVPGSFVEQKSAALAWHYRGATPYQAQKNLVAIRRLLKPIAARYNLTIKNGNKVIEVHPQGISKGRTVQEWLIHDHDFVLIAGDDVTDEDMFRVAPPNAYSIKIRGGTTSAQFRVNNVNGMVDLLDKLARE